jgi:hypothetical protein
MPKVGMKGVCEMAFDVTGIGSIFEFGGKVIDKIFPDKDAADKAKIAMFELQQKGELQQLSNAFELAIKQGEINVTEARSLSTFVAGWRPFVGWVCGFALAYNYVLMPLIVWGALWYDASAPQMPVLDSGELMTLLLGMLGLGAMRSFDKKQELGK